MKYVKLFTSQAEAVGKEVELDIVVGIEGSDKCLYGDDERLGQTDVISAKGDFIQFFDIYDSINGSTKGVSTDKSEDEILNEILGEEI